MLRVIFSLLCLTLLACAHGTPDSTLQEFRVKVGGEDRTYFIKRPAGPVKAVILAMHGGGGEPRRFDFVAGGLGAAAAALNFAVVYPEGIDKQWNDGRVEIAKGHDDIGFFDALLKDLAERQQLPTDKVFATGISNGGLFSFRLACERSEKLYAIAPVAAGIGKALAATCQPKVPVAIIQFFGSKDPIMPFKGGAINVPFSFKDRGEVLSQVETWALWQKLNHCTGHESASYRSAMGSDFSVERDQFTGCPAGVKGEHYLVIGAGHTWPGGAPYLSERLVGAVSRSFVANQEILRFFADQLQIQHPR